MKNSKKALSVFIALMLVLSLAASMATTAFAATTGSITIKGAVAEKNYNLYKVFNLSISGSSSNLAASYTIADGWEDFFSTSPGSAYIVNTQPTGVTLNQIVINNTIKYINITESNVADFAQDALDYAADADPAKITKTPTVSGDYVVDNLSLGYYLVYPEGAADIKDNFASICSLTSTAPNGEVVIKSTYPDIDKVITGVTNRTIAAEGTKVTSANVGDTVTYTITGEVPDMTGFSSYTYILTDTMSEGLSFNNDVAVKIGGNNVTLGNNTVLVSSSTNAAGVTTVTIDFKGIKSGAYSAGDKIVVTYSAVVDQDAIKDASSEYNTVKLEYSNDPDSLDTVGESPERRTDVYTTNINLHKTSDDPDEQLTGAKFKIEGQSRKVVIINEKIYKESTSGTYYRLKNGNYTTDAPQDSTANLYESTGVKYEKVEVIDKNNQNQTFVQEGWVDQYGNLTFNGLGEGTYVITELVAPDGYNILAAPITVVISFDKSTGKFTATADGDDLYISYGEVELRVENSTGTLLPGTGGIGTTIFYIFGAILVIGAAVVIITRKRVNKSEQV